MAILRMEEGPRQNVVFGGSQMNMGGGYPQSHYGGSQMHMRGGAPPQNVVYGGSQMNMNGNQGQPPGPPPQQQQDVIGNYHPLGQPGFGVVNVHGNPISVSKTTKESVQPLQYGMGWGQGVPAPPMNTPPINVVHGNTQMGGGGGG